MKYALFIARRYLQTKKRSALVSRITSIAVGGVFVGSAFWWLIVTGTIASARTRISSNIQRIINIVAGLALVVFGVLAIGSVLV